MLSRDPIVQQLLIIHVKWHTTSFVTERAVLILAAPEERTATGTNAITQRLRADSLTFHEPFPKPTRSVAVQVGNALFPPLFALSAK